MRSQLQVIRQKIYEISGQKVMLDFDLAELYGVETRTFNQAVKRNIERFPEDFMFQLTDEERRRSQIVIASGTGMFRNRKYLPYAFTEHGVIWPSLKSLPHFDPELSVGEVPPEVGAYK